MLQVEEQLGVVEPGNKGGAQRETRTTAASIQLSSEQLFTEPCCMSYLVLNEVNSSCTPDVFSHVLNTTW